MYESNNIPMCVDNLHMVFVTEEVKTHAPAGIHLSDLAPRSTKRVPRSARSHTTRAVPVARAVAPSSSRAGSWKRKKPRVDSRRQHDSGKAMLR
jgi:hypothetical protein